MTAVRISVKNRPDDHRSAKLLLRRDHHVHAGGGIAGDDFTHGVPDNSPLGAASTAFASLAQIRTALASITTVLGLMGVSVPVPLSGAASAITRVSGLAPGRFRKGDLIGFWELFTIGSSSSAR